MVLVVGGGPAGVAAAISAGRAGTLWMGMLAMAGLILIIGINRIQPGLWCVGCGACVVVCPVQIISVKAPMS